MLINAQLKLVCEWKRLIEHRRKQHQCLPKIALVDDDDSVNIALSREEFFFLRLGQFQSQLIHFIYIQTILN